MTFDGYDGAGEREKARKPRVGLHEGSAPDTDLEVVYRRIADLASDHLIRESGCRPPPRAETRFPQIVLAKERDGGSGSLLWRLLNRLGRAVGRAFVGHDA